MPRQNDDVGDGGQFVVDDEGVGSVQRECASSSVLAPVIGVEFGPTWVIPGASV
jgi:hypothetical protein